VCKPSLGCQALLSPASRPNPGERRKDVARGVYAGHAVNAGLPKCHGRLYPSLSRTGHGVSRRGLIKPPEGCGIAYIDFASQEIGIAAALSGDERMADGYREGDPYLAFAKAAQLVPADATKTTHKLMRERCKAVVLGINYGMGPEAMALQAGITPAEAKELLQLHNETYRPFWRWIGDMVSSAMLTNKMQTVFGWRRRVGRDANPRSLMNFPMQSHGAEMMRIAAIAATVAMLAAIRLASSRVRRCAAERRPGSSSK
jgi:DNA polymerase I